MGLESWPLGSLGNIVGWHIEELEKLDIACYLEVKEYPVSQAFYSFENYFLRTFARCWE